MTVKVTVVVPTYNSGRHIEPLVRSMLEQTMPSDEFEVLFVDDGSTDDTPARLTALVAEHAHFRMIRLPNSGWPGKPRNTAVEEALGEYVQFIDHDDFMGPEALQRMYDLGHANGSDIVIGKVASNFRLRGIPHALMSRTRESCTVETAPLHDSLTIHKMYRTGFLRDEGIRFPVGHWVGEDLLFMVPAVFRAKSVSVVGDYPCYYYLEREDGGHATPQQLDPESYSGNLREIFDALFAETEPGPMRDKWLRRFWRADMVKYLSDPIFPSYEPERRSALFKALRAVAADYLNDEVYEGLVGLERVRAGLFLGSQPDRLLELAVRAAGIRGLARLDEARWGRGRLRARFSAHFETGPAGTPLTLVRRGDRYYLDPTLTDGIVDEPVDVTENLKNFRADVSLRHQESSVVWLLPREVTLSLEEETAADGTALVRPVVHGTAVIDPRRAAGGAALDEGHWEVQIRLLGPGLDRYTRIGEGTASLPAPEILGSHEISSGFDSTGLTLSVNKTDANPPAAAPKVSVVVAARSASPEALRETLASLAAQTLPVSDVEVIVVGTGDGQIGAAPGTDPRNSGIDAATGQYVFFIEPGDRLAPEALQRMYAFGMEHDSDVVAGKLAGKGRAVPKELFLRDRPKATLAKDPLADSLTANKLFDRDLLTRHALRFSEHQGPFSDQAFVTEAYVRANHAAVLGSYVCYHYGPKQPTPAIPPADFYASLGELLKTAEGLTEPGPARDRLHRRWLRVEVLDRLSGKRLLELDEEARRELFDAVRAALTDRVAQSAVAGLPASQRLAIGLLTDNRPDDLVRVAEWESSIACRPRLTELGWKDDGALHLAFTAELRSGDRAIGVTTVGGDHHTLAPAGLPEPLLDRFAAERLTGGASPEKASVALVLRERGSGAEYRLRTESAVTPSDQGLTVTGTADLDPGTVVAGAPLGDGIWDLSVRLSALGWAKSARLGSVRADEVPEELTAVAHPTAPDRRITPYWTNPQRDLSLRVAVPKAPKPAPKPGLLRRIARVVRGR